MNILCEFLFTVHCFGLVVYKLSIISIVNDSIHAVSDKKQTNKIKTNCTDFAAVDLMNLYWYLIMAVIPLELQLQL